MPIVHPLPVVTEPPLLDSGAQAARDPEPRAARFVFLDQDAVIAAGVFDMAAAMEAVGAALVAWHDGLARQPPKLVLRASDDPRCEQQWRVNGLCAAIGEPVRSLGMKWIASFPPNRAHGLPRASGLLILNSPETGLPLALMDATLISAVRTGAVTGLGLRHLAPVGARRAVVVGAGVQARTQVLALITACPQLEQISIVHPRLEAAEACASDCRRQWGTPALAADQLQPAVETADVVITATTALEPVLPARGLQPGALTVQIAGHECEFGVVAACSKIVCDDWETIKHRGIPTPARMHAAGLLDDSRIHANLGQLLTGERSGREHPLERIHFAHIGLGLDDVALAALLYRRALSLNLGQWLRLWRAPLWV